MATSFAFHLAILFAVISSAAGTLTSGGGQPNAPADSGAAMTVTFVKASDLAPRSSGDSPSIQSLNIKVRNIQESDAVYRSETQGHALSQLMDRLQAAQPQAPLKQGEKRSQTHLSTLDTSSDADGAQDLATDSSSTGVPWGKIEPCWRKTPGSSAVPVTLEVAFNSRGGVAKPPRILRGVDDKLNEQRLSSEARAIAALKACAPPADARLSNQVVRLEFRPTN